MNMYSDGFHSNLQDVPVATALPDCTQSLLFFAWELNGVLDVHGMPAP